jgi:hypothetical protein
LSIGSALICPGKIGLLAGARIVAAIAISA